MSKELTTINNLFGGLATTETVEELVALDDLSQGSDFLKRIQLYSKGKHVDKKLVEAGNFGIPLSAEKITQLGETVDVLLIKRRAKAIDMSDLENLIITYDSTSDEFRRIEGESTVKDSGCSYGPSYLIFERVTGKFYEFFCGSKSARIESSAINTYLPVTEAMIEAGLTEETKIRGPKPCTLRAHLVETPRHTWHVPQSEDCLTPFAKLPTPEQIAEEVHKFRNPEEPEVEVVQKDSRKRKR